MTACRDLLLSWLRVHIPSVAFQPLGCPTLLLTSHVYHTLPSPVMSPPHQSCLPHTPSPVMSSVNRHKADPVTGGITFKFITTEEWGNEATLLQERSSKAKAIAGTQRLHCFVPVDTSTLQVLEYSASCDQSCTSCGITSKKYV